MKTEYDEIIRKFETMINPGYLATAHLKLQDKKDKNGVVRAARPDEVRSIAISPDKTVYRDDTKEVLFCRVRISRDDSYFSFSAMHRDLLTRNCIPFYTAGSDLFPRIALSELDSLMLNENFHQAANQIFLSAFNNKAFGCCARYEECSRAGHCVHEDLLYASSACQYKKNLDKGKVFY